MLQAELEKIGLSEKEAKVYLAALQLGQAPVQKIATRAKVNRATTYVILESLAAKGLISTVEEAKKRLFIAEGPHALHNVISDQQNELKKKEVRLKDLMPELTSLYNLHPSKPVVRFYEGKEGLKTILEERLKEAPKEVLVMFSQDDVRAIFTQEEADEYRRRRMEKDTYYSGICSVANMDEPLKYEMAEFQKVSHQDYPFFSDIAVYNDKISIATLKGQVSGVVIESKAAADTFRSIFKLISDLLKK